MSVPSGPPRRRRRSRELHEGYVPYVTWSVAAISTTLSVAFWLSGMRQGTWGEVPLERIWSGDWGGLVTSALLHANPLQNPFHLLFNLLWLIRLGPLVERALGRLEYIVFLAIAALIGSGVQMAWSSQESVGLSGVVYAVWGLCWAARRSVTSFQVVSTRQTAQYMIGWLLLCIALTYAGQMQVANGAHVGGLIFGVAVGWLFVDRGLPLRYKLGGGALLALVGALTVMAVTYLPWSPRWRAWKAAQAAGVPAITAAQW